MKRPCLITQREMYYRDVDLGNDRKARLRTLTKLEDIEISEISQDDKSSILSRYKSFYLAIYKSLQDVSKPKKTFNDGGAGWTLLDERGDLIEPTLENIENLDEEIFGTLITEFLLHRKAISENLSVIEKN